MFITSFGRKPQRSSISYFVKKCLVLTHRQYFLVGERRTNMFFEKFLIIRYYRTVKMAFYNISFKKIDGKVRLKI